jgi:Ca2+-binding EF-hand superfamily protein
MPSLVASLDTDRDGIISAAEISASQVALKRLDANGDGVIADAELFPGFGRGGPDGRGGEGRGREGLEGRGRGEGGTPSTSADDLTATLMAFDKNADGKLVKSEVPERFQGLFDRADVNKDGEITRDELKQSATSQVQTGGDGGRGERGGGPGGRSRGPEGRGPGGPSLDPVLNALDTDHDGALSAAEVAAAPRSLGTLDTNKDGQLTADETRSPFGRGRGGRR